MVPLARPPAEEYTNSMTPAFILGPPGAACPDCLHVLWAAGTEDGITAGEITRRLVEHLPTCPAGNTTQ